ncbi:unnamed protein product [Porites evermanni]|uniref:Ribosomal protein L31 n=1 Tax=Porites evermanni TaxID=104178 RepID=A0ABN8R059_9CNID|nr:unnamed protein product [Porites evermanni]
MMTNSSLLKIVKTFSSDIKMEFGLKRVLGPSSKEVALPVLPIFISITLSPSKNWSKKELTNIWVSEDFGSGFSLTPADLFLSGIPVIETHNPHHPDYGKKSSTDKLLEIWDKGQQRLNSL